MAFGTTAVGEFLMLAGESYTERVWNLSSVDCPGTNSVDVGCCMEVVGDSKRAHTPKLTWNLNKGSFVDRCAL